MKVTNSRKVMTLFGSILSAMLTAGCFGGDPSYPNNDREYSYPQSYRNSYDAGYQKGVQADEHRDRDQARDTDRRVVVTHEREEPRTETQHSMVDRDEHSRNVSGPAHHPENN
jgi:hypothetical protein